MSEQQNKNRAASGRSALSGLVSFSWSDKPPSVAGWYWWEPKPDDDPIMIFVFPRHDQQMTATGFIGKSCREYGGRFAGPIPEPTKS